MAEETPVHISPEISALVDGAFEAGKPVVVAYADREGQPHISFRGSTQGHSDDQLAIWVREAKGGLLEALPNNNHITLMYRDGEHRTTFFFYGRGHVPDDPAIAKAIYEKTPKGEREKDPDMKGVPLVIDIDAIQGGTADYKVSMRRT